MNDPVFATPDASFHFPAYFEEPHGFLDKLVVVAKKQSKTRSPHTWGDFYPLLHTYQASVGFVPYLSSIRIQQVCGRCASKRRFLMKYTKELGWHTDIEAYVKYEYDLADPHCAFDGLLVVWQSNEEARRKREFLKILHRKDQRQALRKKAERSMIRNKMAIKNEDILQSIGAEKLNIRWNTVDTIRFYLACYRLSRFHHYPNHVISDIIPGLHGDVRNYIAKGFRIACLGDDQCSVREALRLDKKTVK